MIEEPLELHSELVGARGFEPRTPCAQGRCATRLRYAPTKSIINVIPDKGVVVTFVTSPESGMPLRNTAGL